MRRAFRTIADVLMFAAVMAAMTIPARCEDYRPDPDPPPVKIAERLDKLDARMDRIERKLDAALPAAAVARPAPTPAPVAAPAAVARSSYVTGQGHTHTCSRGHTWDHGSGIGHNCPVCGEAQYVQDSPGVSATAYLRSAGLATSGCSGAGCSGSSSAATVTTTRRGLFRR